MHGQGNDKKTLAMVAMIAVFWKCLLECKASDTRNERQDDGVHAIEDVFISVANRPFSMAIIRSDGERIMNLTSLTADVYADVSFQRLIYEGYSLRLGTEIHRYNCDYGYKADSTNSTSSYNVHTSHIGFIKVDIGRCHSCSKVVEESVIEIKLSSDRLFLADRLGFNIEIDEDEEIFGFGERFKSDNSGNQRGEELYNWVEDGGFGLGTDLRLPKGLESTYLPMPWFLSSKGYGILLNTTYRSEFDVGKSSPSKIKVNVETREVQILVFAGHTPAESLHLFTEVTGRSLVPPPVQFGPWNMFKHEFEDLNAKPYEALLRFIEMDVPTSVFRYELHFFPEGDQMGEEDKVRNLTASFKAYGIPTLVYFNSMISENYSALYDVGVANGYFVRDSTTDDVWLFDYKGAGVSLFKVALVDFTNPNATAWYQEQMTQAVEDLGCGGWMYDYGEYVDPYTTFSDGRTGIELHNEYPVMYQKAAFDFFMSLDSNKSDPYAPPYIFYVRSGYVGSAKVTWCQWTGDPDSDWSEHTGLPAQIGASLTAGLGGIAFSGSDISGFDWIDTQSKELWIRWIQVGALSGVMHDQEGGSSLLNILRSHQFDWKDVGDIYRRYAKFRTQLFPYLYTAAHDAFYQGLPLMRHHILSFPSDKNAYQQPYQYMLGASMLCAPVVTQGALEQSIYLPNGYEWLDFSSKLIYNTTCGGFRIGYSSPFEGNQTITVSAPLDTAPIFIKAGVGIPALDPSVFTLGDATNGKVVSMKDMDHLLHVWLFPTSSLTADMTTWDGAKLTVTPYPDYLSERKVNAVSDRWSTVRVGGSASALNFTASDERLRTWIIQLPLVALPTKIINGTFGVLPFFDSWESISYEHSEGWAWDNEQSVCWIAISTSSTKSLQILL